MSAHRTLSNKIQELRDIGYSLDFQVENNLLTCTRDDSIQLSAEEIKINERHRFEGMSNPDDLSILYAIETPNGKKGLLVDGYGAYNSEEVANFMRAVNS